MPRNDMIQFRRGSSDQWALINPTLAEGEVGYTTDTKQTRIGDGLTPWLSLPLSSADEALDIVENGRLSEAELNTTFVAVRTSDGQPLAPGTIVVITLDKTLAEITATPVADIADITFEEV